MKTYGTAHLASDGWRLQVEPHVMIRLKRWFPRIDTRSMGVATLKNTPEACRDLAVFLERFPLQLAEDDAKRLRAGADEYVEQATIVDRLVSGVAEARAFEMKLPPRDYQRVAAEVALRTRGLLVADDLGLGKTCTAICALTDPSTRPALIVTAPHLARQWQNEIRKFAPALRTHVLASRDPYDLTRPPRKAKRAARNEDQRRRYEALMRGEDPDECAYIGKFPDVVISSYHKLSGWAETLAQVIKGVVYDEVQELRHHDSDKYAAAMHISEHAGFRLGLSATPIYNYGGEIHSVMSALRPDALGDRGEFGREWCTYVAGDKPKIADPKAFGTYLLDQGLMIRRTRRDVSRELAALSKVAHHVDADERELDRLTAGVAELAKIILARSETHRGAKMHAAEEFNNRMRQATGIAKAPAVADFVKLLVDAGERVVLFGWHREVYRIWMDSLGELRPALYTGSETTAAKEASIARFTSNDTPILIMSLRSGAGVDGLQHHCRTVVFGELDWSPGVLEQCIGRVHRDGQRDPVVAYYLLSEHGADPIMSDVLGVKRQQIEGLRDPRGASFEELQVDENHVKKLAAAYLSKHGEAAPESAEASA